MTDPATLRALAARVMAGTATNNGVSWLDIYRQIHPAPTLDMQDDFAIFDKWAAGWRDYQEFVSDQAYLDAADLLMAPLRERGWKLTVTQVVGLRWRANGTYDPDGIELSATATTEPRARTALALLCRAVEMEGEG